MAITDPARAVARPVLRCEGLHEVYRMGNVDVRALDGVDFALHGGELLVLVGASGSGKSTVLNVLGGLDLPTAGRVFHEAHELTDADDDELTRYRREHVGFVFQFYNLIPSSRRARTSRWSRTSPTTRSSLRRCSSWSASAIASITSRPSSRAASSSASRSRAPSPSAHRCCCATSATGALDFRTGILVLDVIERRQQAVRVTIA